MRTRHRLISSLCLALVACSTGGTRRPATEVDEQTVLFRNFRVFDGQAVTQRQSILVTNGRISATGQNLSAPPGATVIEGANRTLLPGLIDAHTHIMDAKQLIQALAFGVTFELDMMSVPQATRAIRAGQAGGGPEGGADFQAAGYIATVPGGHGTEYGFPVPTLQRPDEAAAFVAARQSEGSDYLKISYDDGRGILPGIFRSLTPQTFRALIEAAHARTMRAVVHVHSRSEAQDAIEAGADGLVHVFADQGSDSRLENAMVERRAWVTPTLSVLRTLKDGDFSERLAVDPALAKGLSPAQTRVLKRRLKLPANSPFRYAIATAAIRRLHERGVPILAGTDAGNLGTTHGASMHGELELLVEAGLTPLEALRSATAVPAQHFGLGDRGRIAVGARADLVVVEGDPTTRITDSRRIVGIWKAGREFAREAYLASIAAEQAAVAALAAAEPPRGLREGYASDFDRGEIASRFGAGWTPSTDTDLGGTSTAELTLVPEGAEGSAGALKISGVARADGQVMLAGALFHPGLAPYAPAHLAPATQLVFWANVAAGVPFAIQLFSQLEPFRTHAQYRTGSGGWKRYEIRMDAFDGIETFGVQALGFAPVRPGPYEILLDQVEFR